MGKSIPAIIIGFLEAMFIVTMAVFWFEVSLQGSLWLLILGILVFLLSSMGVGLMISSFSVTQQQALLGAFLSWCPQLSCRASLRPISNMPQTPLRRHSPISIANGRESD